MTIPMLGSAVVAADPRKDPHWLALSSAQGSLFTSPPWIRAVCDSYGFTPQARITVDAEGIPRDGFTWVEIDDIRGDRLVSLPFSDRAEPILSDRSTWPVLVDDALKTQAPLTIRCLEGGVPTAGPRFDRVGEAAWHATPLDAPLEELHRSLHPSARRAVGTAERRGVEVRALTGIDAVRTFHGIHLLLRKRKYRLLAQSVDFFERIWEEFSPADGIVTWLAYADGDPIAGAIGLVWGDTLYFKFAASRTEALPLLPNYAVYWNVVKSAAEAGLRLVDWGLSDLDQPGLVAYKRKWCSTEGRVITVRSSGRGAAQPSPAGPLLAGLTDLFTDESVPDAITAQAGSLLYRFFA